MKITPFFLLFVIFLKSASCLAQPSIAWSYISPYNSPSDYPGKFVLTDSHNRCYSIRELGGITKFELDGDTAFTYNDSLIALQPKDAIMDHDDHIIVAWDYFTMNNDLIVVTKIDTNGTLLWRLIVNAPSGFEDRVNSIDIDAENNIYLTGYDGNQITGNLYTAKISSGGILIWETSINTSVAMEENEGFDIAVRDSNNIYSVGDVYESFSLPCDTWVVKYNHVGDTIWTRRFDFEDYVGGTANASDFAKKISIDPAGNIYILSFSTAFFNSVVAKYNSNGILQWAHKIDSVNRTYFNDLLVDSTGIYAGGYEKEGSPNYFEVGCVVKFDFSGNRVWKSCYPNTQLWGKAIARHKDGVILSASTEPGLGSTEQFVTLRFDSAGALDWIHFVPNTSGIPDNIPYDVAVDKLGGIYVTGLSDNSINEHATFKLVDCIDVNSPTSAYSSSGNNTICAGQSVKLYQVGGFTLPPGFFKWYTFQCGSGSTVGIGDSITVSPTQTTTYFVRLEGICTPGPCVSITIVVNPFPVSQILNPSLVEICQGDTVILQAVPTLGNTYQWMLNGSNILNAVQEYHSTTFPGTYTILTTNTIGCSKVSGQTRIRIVCLPIPDPIDRILFSSDESDVTLRLFPNPNKGKFQCTINSPTPGDLTIINSLGQELVRKHCNPSENNLEIDFSGNPAGIYLVKFESGNKTYSVRTMLVE